MKQLLTIKAFAEATRPKTLIAALGPVLLGASLAHYHGATNLFVFILTLIAAWSIQIGTNYANDYFDHHQGADTEERKGPIRPVHRGELSPKQMLWGALFMFSFALILCLFLLQRGGMQLLFLGIISVACGIWYTAGKYALAYTGLADVFAFAFFGPIATGYTYYLITLEHHLHAFAIGIAPGAFSLALLTVNNLRDMKEDKNADKKTLCVRFGRRFGIMEWMGSLGLMFITPVWFIVQGYPSWLGISCLALIPMLLAISVVRTVEGPELNRVLATTATALLLYSILFSIPLFIFA